MGCRFSKIEYIGIIRPSDHNGRIIPYALEQSMIDEVADTHRIYIITSKMITTPLHIASKDGRIDLVESLIARNADIYIRDQKGFTALHHASLCGHADVVKALLDLNQRQTYFPCKYINMKCRYGATALICASFFGHLDVVKALLDAHASINTRDNGWSYLVYNDRDFFIQKKVQSYLKHRPSKLCNYGYTALMAACSNGHVHIVQELLSKRAHVNFQNTIGITALIVASENGHISVVERLLEHEARVNAQDYDGDTALICASIQGHLHVVRLLLQANAKVDMKNKYGATALTCASYHGHFDIVKELLANHAYVDTQDDGWSALQSIRKKDIPLEKLECYLKEKGSTLSDYGDTALMAASFNGHIHVVKELLTNNAQIDFCNKRGTTALMAACDEGHVDVVEELLDRGARIDIQDDDGDSALLLACKNGHIGVVEILLNHSIRTFAELQSHVGSIEWRIDLIDSQDLQGRNALSWACQYGFIEVVKILLQHRAKVDVQDSKGKTALMLASGHCDIVKALLDNYANINLMDKSGSTALMWACEGGYAQSVKLLLENNADVDIQNENGETALMVARRKGHIACWKVLMKDVNELVVLYQASCCKGKHNESHKCTLKFDIHANHHNTDLVYGSYANNDACQECPICLQAFLPGDDVAWSLRQTSCRHVFHMMCIEAWLETSTDLNCPCCRGNYYHVFTGEDSLVEPGKKTKVLPCIETRRHGCFCVTHGLVLP